MFSDAWEVIRDLGYLYLGLLLALAAVWIVCLMVHVERMWRTVDDLEEDNRLLREDLEMESATAEKYLQDLMVQDKEIVNLKVALAKYEPWRRGGYRNARGRDVLSAATDADVDAAFKRIMEGW